MSWKVANLCAERKFGSPVRKQIIMFLADKASDDGSGIWCSKGTVQRHTELGESTVKRTITEFLNEGILIETGRRSCKNGYTVIYRIVLSAISDLEPIAEPEDEPATETGATADGVRRDPGTGSALDGVPGPQRTPNHPKTIQKPPTRASAPEAEEAEIEVIWQTYPADRRRDRTSCRRHLAAALTEVSLAELIAAVKAYAAESEDFTRSKVSYLDNWLRGEKWWRYVDELRRQEAQKREATERLLGQAVSWIKARHGMCRHLTEAQVATALDRGLITKTEAQAAGFLR